MLIFIVTIVGLVLEGNIDAKSPINKINNDNLDVAKTTNDVYDESSLINIYVPFSKNNADEAIAKPTLEEACQYIMDSDIEGGIIHITENISVDQMNLNKNVKVIIKSDDSTPYTITKICF